MKEKDEEELDEDNEGSGSIKQKITIIGDDYKLQTISADNTHWNLYILKANKKGEEVWVCEGYGYILSQAMPKIINYKIARKLNGQAITLKQYLQIWLKIKQQLTKDLKGL